ncbi:MAG: glycosyltransferase family A protein [Patescibacteria group bacterium]|nr:glycosyltransferase family A protein [Patescibacteria group bacterium]
MAIIDIVIPVYNQARTISRCLQSIEKQSASDVTISVVDDGSTDNLLPVLSPYRERIRFIRQSNAGASAARNRGAREGSAPFILFCDADVILKPNFLHTHLHVLQNNPQKSYAYASFRWGWKAFRPGPFDPVRLHREPYINTHAVIRRAHFPGFDETLKRFQDWDLWLTILDQGREGVWIDQQLFTVRPGGTMSRWLPKAAYRLLPRLRTVREYRAASEIVKMKHAKK